MVTVMFIMPESKVDVEDDSSKMLFLAGESVSDLIHDADDPGRDLEGHHPGLQHL